MTSLAVLKERAELRADFAKAAMVGLIASRGVKVNDDQKYIDKIAWLSVKHADALIDELNAKEDVPQGA